jgi:hypothetical protein
MADVSLSDQYVLLLNDVVKENKALRDKIDQNITLEQNTMRDLANKIDNLDGKIASLGERRGQVRQTGGGRIPVPKMCSVSILYIFNFVYQTLSPMANACKINVHISTRPLDCRA